MIGSPSADIIFLQSKRYALSTHDFRWCSRFKSRSLIPYLRRFSENPVTYWDTLRSVPLCLMVTGNSTTEVGSRTRITTLAFSSPIGYNTCKCDRVLQPIYNRHLFCNQMFCVFSTTALYNAVLLAPLSDCAQCICAPHPGPLLLV